MDGGGGGVISGQSARMPGPEHWQMDASPYRSQSESLGMC